MEHIKGSINGHSYEIKPVLPEDVVEISLRELDALELKLTLDKEGIAGSVECSEESYLAEIDGEPHAYFGVTNLGVVWWLSSWKPFEVSVGTFQALSDIFIDECLNKYKCIWNTTLTKNTVSLEWLRSKGFTLEETGGEWTRFWKEIT